MKYLICSRSNATPRASHSMSLLILAFGLLLILTVPAHAGFIGYYAPQNFTLFNTNADGFVTTLGGGSAVALTGGNTGSGLPGTTDLLIHAAASGVVSFEYFYMTFDDPEFDSASYWASGLVKPFQPLFSANPVPLSFTVSAGDTVGFRVSTNDNTFGAGVLTISNFSAPQAVPEPTTGALIVLSAAGCAVWRAVRRRAASRGGHA